MSVAEARSWGGKIKDLGEQIVGLTVLEAKELGDYLEEVHGIKAAAGAVAVAQSSYPGFIVGFMLGTMAGRAGLETLDIGGESVLYRDLGEGAHLMAKTYGPTMFFALAPSKEQAQKLIETVMANQQD